MKPRLAREIAVSSLYQMEMNDVSAGQYTLTWIGTNGTLGNARLQKR